MKYYVVYQVMDTAGQDEYSIMSSGYDGMDGYIIVYDITNRKSFEVSSCSLLARIIGSNPILEYQIRRYQF